MFLSNNGQPELTNLFLFPMSPAPSSKKKSSLLQKWYRSILLQKLLVKCDLKGCHECNSKYQWALKVSRRETVSVLIPVSEEFLKVLTAVSIII